MFLNSSDLEKVKMTKTHSAQALLNFLYRLKKISQITVNNEKFKSTLSDKRQDQKKSNPYQCCFTS